MSRIRVCIVGAALAGALLTTGPALASSSPWHETPCGSSTANDYDYGEPVHYQIEDPIFSGTALIVSAAADAGYADLTVSPSSSRLGLDGGNDRASVAVDATSSTRRVCVAAGDQQVILP